MTEETEEMARNRCCNGINTCLCGLYCTCKCRNCYCDPDKED